MSFLNKVLFCLPQREYIKINDFLSRISVERVTELRFRADAPSSITFEGRNVCVFSGDEIRFSEEELADIVAKLCEESIHTYSESMKQGYITLDDGIRIGVCGSVVCDGERIISIRRIKSLCIRLPHIIRGACDGIIPLILQGNVVHSALFYSLPGVGKTTLIRDIAMRLGSGAKRLRVCVVDSRGEIYMKGIFDHSLCDFLDGYPKGTGIEIATRAFSPQVLICDEIGDEAEARAIIAAQNSGVPLIATAHGADIASIMLRPNIKLLYDAGIFRYYIGVRRDESNGKYTFSITDTERRLE